MQLVSAPHVVAGFPPERGERPVSPEKLAPIAPNAKKTNTDDQRKPWEMNASVLEEGGKPTHRLSNSSHP
jgi:hypothetical protein